MGHWHKVSCLGRSHNAVSLASMFALAVALVCGAERLTPFLKREVSDLLNQSYSLYCAWYALEMKG